MLWEACRAMRVTPGEVAPKRTAGLVAAAGDGGLLAPDKCRWILAGRSTDI